MRKKASKASMLLKFVIGMIIAGIILGFLIYGIKRITQGIIGNQDEMIAKGLIDVIKNAIYKAKEEGSAYVLLQPINSWNLVYIPSDRNEIGGFKKPNIFFGQGVLCVCKEKNCKYCIVSKKIINKDSEYLSINLDEAKNLILFFNSEKDIFTYSLTKEIVFENPSKDEIEAWVNQYNVIIDENPKIDIAIKNASEKHDVDTSLIKAIIKAESNFNVKAVSPCGAAGIMQLISATAKQYGLNVPDYGTINEEHEEKAKQVCGASKISACNSLQIDSGMPYLSNCDFNNDERFNVEKNIDAGTQYVAYLIKEFPSLSYAIAAYHEGEGKIMKECQCNKESCKIALNQCISNDVIDYVKKVLRYKVGFEKAEIGIV